MKHFLGYSRTLGGNEEECCKAKGVSRFCYGFCRLDDDDSSARSGMARRACIEYEEVIETCMNGNQCYVFIHELQVYTY